MLRDVKISSFKNINFCKTQNKVDGWMDAIDILIRKWKKFILFYIFVLVCEIIIDGTFLE